VPNPALIPTLRRRPAALRLLALLLATFAVGSAPAGALAQSIMQEPLTKEQAAQAEQQAAEDANPSDSSSSDNSVKYGLLAVGVAMLVGASWWIVHDSGDAVTEHDRRTARQPIDTDAVGRGAPKAMFTGEGEPGGKSDKRKRRDQGKRQRQARKANRPR
jgi:hypothetical protein